ncbi:MAG: hypothetical protein IVW51_06630 [Thermaceae bacterium]|nr:hypothetical protein [Thermaceae bacterium]
MLGQQHCEPTLALQVRHGADFQDAYLVVLGGEIASFNPDFKKLGVGSSLDAGGMAERKGGWKQLFGTGRYGV